MHEKKAGGGGGVSDGELTGGVSAVRNMVWDLHLDLLTTYHRICLKTVAYSERLYHMSASLFNSHGFLFLKATVFYLHFA